MYKGSHVYFFPLQLMGASQNGRSGVLVPRPVAREYKRESGCVITPLQPMEEDPAWEETWM